MIEPFGYFDILFQTLQIFSLIGLFILFFLERSTYGRDSIGHETWPTVLLYNVLTAYAYGIYWRLKASYALHSRDRFSSWQWALVLITIFIISLTHPKFLTLLMIWDFLIGYRLSKITDKDFSWIWTFLFGHLYLASFVEREAHLLPIDFRAARPERRQRIVNTYSAVLVSVLVVIAGSYWALVGHRREEFTKIPTETVDRTGHWHEVDEKYETIYYVDRKGQMNIYTWIKNPRKSNLSEWARYNLDTKFHNGNLYSYNWFTCVRKDRVVEMKPDLLLLKNVKDRTLIESRIKTEEFAELREMFLGHSAMDRGWELGELLKSPWQCELEFITEAWTESIDFIKTGFQNSLAQLISS